MRVLFADSFPEAGLAELKAAGFDCEIDSSLGPADLPAATDGFDVLVVRSTEVGADVFTTSPCLGLVVRAGAGTNTIDKDAAAANAVMVSNVPGKNAVAVAELTMGLLLSLDRRIPDNVVSAAEGEWKKGEFSKAQGVMGKTLGIIGFGAIGQEVARRAGAFGMGIVVVDRQRPEDVNQLLKDLEATQVGSLLELAAASDVVTLHVPATGDTAHLIDETFLEAMRPGSLLINTSRASVMDEPAVLEAIENKGLRVGVDVFDGEPGTGAGSVKSALASHPKVYVTHHIGASTEQAQTAVAEGVIDVLTRHRAGESINTVNLAPTTGGVVLTVRHQDKVGVLSDILRELKRSGANVQEMTNHVFSGAGAALANIRVSTDVSADVLEVIDRAPGVIHCSMRDVL